MHLKDKSLFHSVYFHPFNRTPAIVHKSIEESQQDKWCAGFLISLSYVQQMWMKEFQNKWLVKLEILFVKDKNKIRKKYWSICNS